MKKIKYHRLIQLMGMVLSTLLILSIAQAQSEVLKNRRLSLGSSSVGSANYLTSVKISKMIKEYTGAAVNVEPTGGSGGTMRTLAQGKIELCLVNTLTAWSAFSGTMEFKEMPVKNLRMLLQGQLGPRVIIVREDSGINKLEDLAGKTLMGKRRTLPDNEIITKAYLRIAKIPENKVKIIESQETNEQLEALKRGSIDAATVPLSGTGSSALMRLAADVKLKVLSVPKDKIKELKEILGNAFQISTLPPKSFFDYQDYEIVAGDVPTLFATRTDKVSDDEAYEMVKAVLDHIDELRSFHRSGAGWSGENTLANLPIPVHEGVVKYFKEKKLWLPEHQRAQEELFKRQRDIFSKQK